MDKLQPIIAFVKKQYFWLLCLGILIASSVVWMMAVDKVEAEANQNLQRIQSSKQDAEQVRNVSQHPNDQIVSSYNQQTESLKLQVYQVWNDLYQKQIATVLKWPAALGENFIKHVTNTPFLGDIPVDFRDLYFNYVKTRWAELPEIIKAKPLVKEATPGNTQQPMSVRKATPDFIVIWDDQERIRKQLFSTLRPTTEWVWITQEDLWLYENLLNIIKKTNEGAIGPHNAVVSTIVSMDVGKSAASDAGGTSQRIATGGGGEGESEDSGSTGGGGGTGLMGGRYIDAAGLPLENGIQAREDEYRRIPVRLVLRMDSSEIPRLILCCANAPLPVEVQQVRINVVEKRGDVRSADLSPEDRAAGRKRPHVEVAMQGVVYIFNPPSRKKLKLPEEESTPTTSTEVFSAEPATTTPTFDDEPAADGSTPAPTDVEAPPMEAGETPMPTDSTTAPEAAPAEEPAVTTTEPAAETPPPATQPATPPAEAPAAGNVEDLFK